MFFSADKAVRSGGSPLKACKKVKFSGGHGSARAGYCTPFQPLRWSLSAAGSMIVTFALVSVMASLMGQHGEITPERTPEFDVTFLRKDWQEEPVRQSRQIKPERETPVPRPQPPGISQVGNLEADTLKVGISTVPDIQPLTVNKKLRFPVSARSAGAPLVKVPPLYPQSLADRGVEGWVTLTFDISPEGRVINPAVVAAEPGDSFVRSALQAVSRWRYRVLMVEGKPAARLNNTVTIEFRLP